MREPVLAWHFVGATLRDGSPVPPDGEWLRHDWEIKMCIAGLHASRRLIDALNYAPGSTICRVVVADVHGEDSDKLVGRSRAILWRLEARDDLLRSFARQVALSVIDLWDAPPIVRQYLKTGAESIRADAWATACDAARDAARDACDAARAAACDAACDAARAAAAGSAAREAAWAATWVPVRDAWAAAGPAARDAARAAAWDAARNARAATAACAAWAEAAHAARDAAGAAAATAAGAATRNALAAADAARAAAWDAARDKFNAQLEEMVREAAKRPDDTALCAELMAQL